MSCIDFQVFSYFVGELIVRHLLAKGNVENFSIRILRRSGRESNHYTIEQVIIEFSCIRVISCLLNGRHPRILF